VCGLVEKKQLIYNVPDTISEIDEGDAEEKEDSC